MSIKSLLATLVVSLSLAAPVLAGETIICSGLKGSGIDWLGGKIKRYEDGLSGTDLILVIDKKSVVITWKGINRIKDEAVLINGSDAQGWVSFVASRMAVTRLYTLFFSSSGGFILAMTEHQQHFMEKTPQSRTFFSKCR